VLFHYRREAVAEGGKTLVYGMSYDGWPSLLMKCHHDGLPSIDIGL
jgi:hypothetical protein